MECGMCVFRCFRCEIKPIISNQMTGMEDDFLGSMERRNRDGIQLRSWKLIHNTGSDSNYNNTDDSSLLHNIPNTRNYNNNIKIEDNSLSEFMNSSSDETTILSCNSKVSNPKVQHDVALDDELITKTNDMSRSMQITRAASVLDSELDTNTFEVANETQAIFPSPSDLSRFCDDIESQVFNFVSEDMLELNHLITGTELEISISNKIEIDENYDAKDFFRPSSSSESSMDSFSEKIIPFEYQSEMSSSSEDYVDKSQYICKITRDSPIFAKINNCYENKNTSDKISNSITVPVATMSESKGAKRKWDKTFLCIFCNKSFTKLPRHWYMKHPNEREVSKIMILSSKSKEKKKLIAELQNKGVALNNTNIIKTGEGSVVPKRRPRPGVKMNVKDYICCRYCNQLFLKTYIEKHERKRCSFNVKSKGKSRTEDQ